MPLRRPAQHRFDFAVRATIQMTPPRNLCVLIKIVKHVHQRVRLRQWQDRPFRKRAAHYVTENHPFVFTMKIVDNDEPATQYVFAQSRDLFFTEMPVTNLLGE